MAVLDVNKKSKADNLNQLPTLPSDIVLTATRGELHEARKPTGDGVCDGLCARRNLNAVNEVRRSNEDAAVVLRVQVNALKCDGSSAELSQGAGARDQGGGGKVLTQA